MRLTTVLGRIKNPNGHIFRGKNRLVRQVTLEDISLLKQKMELEEKNMFYLRHPYLTPVRKACLFRTFYVTSCFRNSLADMQKH